MPEETRYVTLSGQPPNGGVPFGRMFVSVTGPVYGSNPAPYPFNCASGPPPAPPPAYHAPQDNGNGYGFQPYPSPPRRAPNPAVPRYEPPGQYVDGHMLHGDGWSYISPSELTTIHFVDDGTRPCDHPNGYYPHRFSFTKHKVPSVMTVKDLMKGLGAPAGDRNGITEMEEVGDSRFLEKITITQGSDVANRTLAEIGWTQRKSEVAPIWILVKR